MIEGGWSFVWMAYALSLSALAVLALIVVLRLRKWADEARKLK